MFCRGDSAWLKWIILMEVFQLRRRCFSLMKVFQLGMVDGWDLQIWSLLGQYRELGVNTSLIRSDWESARRALYTVALIDFILSKAGDPQQGFLKSSGNQPCSGGRWMRSPELELIRTMWCFSLPEVKQLCRGNFTLWRWFSLAEVNQLGGGEPD